MTKIINYKNATLGKIKNRRVIVAKSDEYKDSLNIVFKKLAAEEDKEEIGPAYALICKGKIKETCICLSMEAIVALYDAISVFIDQREELREKYEEIIRG